MRGSSSESQSLVDYSPRGKPSAWHDWFRCLPMWIVLIIRALMGLAVIAAGVCVAIGVVYIASH